MKRKGKNSKEEGKKEVKEKRKVKEGERGKQRRARKASRPMCSSDEASQKSLGPDHRLLRCLTWKTWPLAFQDTKDKNNSTN